MPVKTKVVAPAVWEITLRTVAGLIKVLENELQEGVDLPLTWYDVLVNLNVAPEGRLRMQALSDSLVLTRSGVTRLIDRIEGAGLVRREPAAEDRRGYYAILTGEGRSALERAQPVHRTGIESHFAKYLSIDDLQALRDIMQKVWTGNPQLAGGRARQ